MNFYRYLDAVGDGSGAKNFNGDYSSVQGVARLNATKVNTDFDRALSVERLIVSVSDTTGFTAQKYGNLAALTNGIEIKLMDDDGEVLDLTDEIPVKTNAQWAQLCYDVDVKSWGSGDELLVVRWTFSKAGAPLILNCNKNAYLAVYLDDNLDGLLSHYFMVQGRVV